MSEDFVKWMRDIARDVHPEFKVGIQQDVDTVIEHGGTTFEAASALLESKETDARTRRLCVWILSRYDVERVAPTLISLLDSGIEEDLRTWAILELGRGYVKDAIDPLLHLLRNDTNQEIRALSAYA